MGPVSPGLFVKLLQKIFTSHKFVKRSFEFGSFLKYELQQLQGHKNAALLHTFEREVPQRVLDDFLYPFVCLPV